MKHFYLPKDGGLIEDNLPKGILHSFERITTEISDDAASASEKVAEIITKAIADHSKSGIPRPFKLGLSTGVTPVSLYNTTLVKRMPRKAATTGSRGLSLTMST